MWGDWLDIDCCYGDDVTIATIWYTISRVSPLQSNVDPGGSCSRSERLDSLLQSLTNTDS